MAPRRRDPDALRDFVEALSEEAMTLLGDREVAYQVIACALADLLGNGSELSKKLQVNH